MLRSIQLLPGGSNFAPGRQRSLPNVQFFIALTSYRIADAVFGAKRKYRIIRGYSRTMRGLRFLSQNLLRTGSGDAGAAFPDNSLRGRSRPIMPADTQSEYPITA